MKAKKAADMSAIDFNPQFRKALELMEGMGLLHFVRNDPSGDFLRPCQN
jgi:hypothetical protein